MSSLPPTLPILPFTQPVNGSVTLPGSKSITNRALILAALGDKSVLLTGALFSRDTLIMIAALRALGFTVEPDEKALTIRIEGRDGEIPVREARIDIGNAGTAARFLTAFVCLRPDGIYHFDGDEAMRRRPIGALLEALESQGAKANSRHFPFTLRTAGLPGGSVELDASESSQMLSALLMVAPHALKKLNVELKVNAGSKPFVEMTKRMIAQFTESPTTYQIEGDASAGSYFLSLPLAVGRGKLDVVGYPRSGSLQGDVRFAGIIEQLESYIKHESYLEYVSGGVRVFAGPKARKAGAPQSSFEFREFSDTFLTLAAIAPLLAGPTKISGITHTRKQETDRVAGMARELKKLGQHVIENEDSLEIHPRPLTSGVEIETYHDHRFAMSFGILGCHDLHGNGQPWLTIKDPACCSKTFPHFFDLLASLRAASH